MLPNVILSQSRFSPDGIQNFIQSNVSFEINEMLEKNTYLETVIIEKTFHENFQHAPVTNSSYVTVKNGVKSFIKAISYECCIMSDDG